jgi:hypothetical protein
VRFPDYHVHQPGAVQTNHGLDNDEITRVVTAGDLGPVAAPFAGKFKTLAHDVRLLEHLYPIWAGSIEVSFCLRVFS